MMYKIILNYSTGFIKIMKMIVQREDKMSEVLFKQRLKVRTAPEGPSILYQEWRDLLFLHWEYPQEMIQKTLPPGLTVDTFEGKAYIGIIPFFMHNLSLSFLAPIPGLSNFLEVNMRTYVYDRKGRPGVWFYSLDIDSSIASWVASTFFRLPYHAANFKASKSIDHQVEYTGSRLSNPEVLMHFTYQSMPNESFIAQEKSLEFFLVERYLLFTYKNQQLRFQQVHHHPYPLTKVKVEKYEYPLFESNGFKKPRRKPDHALYSSGVDVKIFTSKNS